MKHSIYLAAILALCLSTNSCIKEKIETTYNNQEDKIDQYVEKNRGEMRVVYNEGSTRLVTKEGDGEELQGNGSIAFYYAGYTFTSSISASNLFATNHAETAASAGWTLTDEQDNILTINLGEYELIPGLKAGLIGVKGGEECQIFFSGKYGFGNESVGIVPANSALVYKIWVESISND